MTLTVDAIRECLEGAVPGNVATCAADGTPNVAYVSQVHYVDAEHVALSFQFFNKTRENVLANPRVTALVVHPETVARYRLALEYLRTETEGPLFERMKAKLAGIASHTGMAGVFRLRGSDVYRVLAIEKVPGPELPAQPRSRNLLAALRAAAQSIAAATDLDSVLEAALDCLGRSFGIAHAMVLMLDAPRGRLYTVASRGYDASGVGSEIALGQGVIGVAARERTPIRISHFTSDQAYGRAVRESIALGEHAGMLGTEIPLPGLAQSASQLAVPIVAGGRSIGVLYVESPEDSRFGYDDEDALVALAGQLGTAIVLHQQAAEAGEDPARTEPGKAAVAGPAAVVKHYAANDVVFVDDDYLIKGVAGAILWKLVRDYATGQRTEFTNRELRLDPALRLPDVSDNLEARLVLLARRLAERCEFLRIEKTGRGRFRLCVTRPLELVDVT